MNTFRWALALVVAAAIGCGKTKPVAKAPAGEGSSTSTPAQPAPPDMGSQAIPPPAKEDIPTVSFPDKPKGPKSAPPLGDLAALSYARTNTYLAVHIDVTKLLDAPLVKGLQEKKVDLSQVGQSGVPDVNEALDQAPKWQSVSLFVQPAESETFIPIALYGLFTTREARDEFVAKSTGGQRGEVVDFEGTKYTKIVSPFFKSSQCILPVGELGVYSANEAGVREIITAKGAIRNESLAALLRPIVARGQLTAAIDLEPIRETLSKWFATQEELPLPQLAEVSDWTKSASLVIDLSGEKLLDFDIEAVDKDSAEKLMGFVKSLWGMGTVALASMKEQIEAHPKEHPIRGLYALADSLTQIQANQAGTRVTVKVPRPVGLNHLPELLEGLVREQKKLEKKPE